MAFTSQLGTGDSSLLGSTMATGTSDPGNNFSRSVSQSILSEAVTLPTIFRLAADRVFFFGAFSPGDAGEYGHEATHNIVELDISNAFSFVNQTGQNYDISITQYLNFTPRHFENCGNFFGASTEGEGGLSEHLGEVTSESVVDTISFGSHDSSPGEALKRAYLVDNTLSGTELVQALSQLDVSNFFVLDDLVDSSATEYDRAPTHSVIKQSLSFNIQGAACPEKEYAPFIGSSDDTTYPEVSATAPVLGSGVLTLTHPRVSPTTTLVLKNPEFGNTDTLTFTKIDRTTRGGDRKIFSDPKWGKNQVFQLEAINVCQVDIQEIIDFMNTSLGEEIGLLDWEGRNWKGVILAPNSDVVPEQGGFTVTIVFEGQLS